MKVVSIVRGAKFAAVVLAALAMAGCANKQLDQTAMAGSAAPEASRTLSSMSATGVLRDRFH
jgi:hypothetical protein